MNKCGGRCFGKYCRIVTVKISVVHGISTLLVICYAQWVKVSLDLIFPLYVHVRYDSGYEEQQMRVWFNGNLQYFSKSHLPYGLPAVFILLTVRLLPPILLLSYPLLSKVLVSLGLENQKLIACMFLSLIK